ncbi:restriction endonuclease [Halostagnicola sp. A-GB9-2]|uniref:restriction endonuclease n=1 Tax=Halostagnicola sp. A-GB9-2 TaxID=3048066 RepID=UPI0024BF6325|nr:restriction endonuclease [Halostagnicola sp. A-GB9-2]MDJ1434204.1 hypothetical protein [Halostagnicola sp. A-GB9-2]
MPTDNTPIPNEYYEQLLPLLETIDAVRRSITDDLPANTEANGKARRLLHESHQSLREAKQILPEPDPGAEIVHNTTPDEFDDYEDALTQIEHRLERLLQYTHQEHPDEYRYSESPKLKFDIARMCLAALRDLLPAVGDESKHLPDRTNARTTTGYNHVDGRKQGDGRWLEYQLSRSLKRWGYDVETRQTVFSLEVDVVAKREDKQHEPDDWIVAQCKDWQSRTITPGTIFRLCLVAFACRAMPVLCHTTELTRRAEELARQFEVRVIELEALERAEMPALKVTKPTGDLHDWDVEHRVRENRGSLPDHFEHEPGKRFSYVPGFEPVGTQSEYEPIDDSLPDDSHPAFGH